MNGLFILNLQVKNKNVEIGIAPSVNIKELDKYLCSKCKCATG